MLGCFSHVRLFATPCTVAHHAPLSMGFSRQEYKGGLPCPPLGDLPNPGIEPASLMSPTLSAEFFTTSTTWETHKKQYLIQRQFLFTQDSINNPEIADVADLLALLPMLQAFRNINI